MEDSAEAKPVVAFKSVRKRKNLRQRRGSDDEEERSEEKQEGGYLKYWPHQISSFLIPT